MFNLAIRSNNIMPDITLGRRRAGPTSHIWMPDILQSVAAFLPPNEIACTIRLVNKSAAEQFKHFVTTRLSQSVPAHAFQHRWGFPAATRTLTYEQRTQLLCLTAASSSLVNLKLAIKSTGLLPQPKVLYAAVKAGHVHVCDWLIRSGCRCPLMEMGRAIGESGSKEIYSWAFGVIDLLDDHSDHADPRSRSKRSTPDRFSSYVRSNSHDRRIHAAWAAACAAACSGCEEFLRWLLQRLLEILQVSGRTLRALNPVDLLEGAAEGCGLATLQWLHQQLSTLQLMSTPNRNQEQQLPLSLRRVQRLLSAAARSRRPDWRAKLKWLEELWQQQQQQFNEGHGVPDVCQAVMSHPTEAAERLIWLQQRGYSVSTETALVAACENGCMEAVQVLLSQGLSADAAMNPAAKAAVNGGHLTILQALHSYRPLERADGAHMLELAVGGGHVNIVTWLVEVLGIGLRDGYGELLTKAASRSGRAEMIAWLRERSCPWSSECISMAAKAGCEMAVKYLVDHGCSMPRSGAPYVLAIQNDDLAMLRCLRRLSVPWDPKGYTFTACMRNVGADKRRLPLLEWLVKKGCPVNWLAAKKHAGPGGQLVTSWLKSMKPERRQRKLKCPEKPPGADTD
ncbi:hypothetical protein VaNZ11_008186 [Volvox africanus]|uniref:F-box domain-containing protein n=1 Tax=Volvox africanus TaxID=51714 RepID=A0ABQ5S4F3_9CHLO|nr:hypothetical protein VaNZ11_008186 [Volvox africanus]